MKLEIDHIDHVADALEKAADLILVHGHAKGRFQDRDGRLCTLGALRMTQYGTTNVTAPVMNAPDLAHRNSVYFWAQTFLRDRLRLLNVENIPTWNDMPERTAEEAVDALRQTAKDLRNQR